jgi:protein-S-isoprenylcysteine O-methyltransferase Ste14
MQIPTFVKHWLTEPDNQTFCPVRCAALLGIGHYFATSTAAYVQHGVFDPQAWAVGFGALLAGVGAALGLKKDSPKQ